jgi:hypothetical protein
MTSVNAAKSKVTHFWFGWVPVPSRGRAWASGHVTVPLCTPRDQTYRLIAAWLHEQGCTTPADISHAITLLPGRITPALSADYTPRRG